MHDHRLRASCTERMPTRKRAAPWDRPLETWRQMGGGEAGPSTSVGEGEGAVKLSGSNSAAVHDVPTEARRPKHLRHPLPRLPVLDPSIFRKPHAPHEDPFRKSAGTCSAIPSVVRHPVQPHPAGWKAGMAQKLKLTGHGLCVPASRRGCPFEARPSFGSPAFSTRHPRAKRRVEQVRPVALRPSLATGLPFRDSQTLSADHVVP